ncbi:hypothetical protein UCRNP2_5732 [Neofusicoccum parvum UCRNP2]|uniref:Uncharacterized protein n=1 Tax=Botryosphaeria parva (strain UCR-NP2) TaxID=1287680 RepID=R1GNL5_BOTPV|nr:hypothetical protein UCRNP2_5732 [Neofusicoccum parvum UCRNP2]
MYDATTFSDSSSADNLGYISGQSPFDGQASSSFNNYPPLNNGSAYFTGYGTTPGSPQAFNPYNTQFPRDQRNRGGRFKTNPEEAWIAHERRQSQHVIILGWEDLDHVNFLETTTFTNRRITQVFPDENDERRQDFLLITDSRMAPHSGLPTVDLEGGRSMPRVSYIKFRVKRTGKFSNFRRFADRRSLDNRYVVTRDGMDIVRDYLVKREGHMKEYAAIEKQEQEEKMAKAAESAKALEEQQRVAEAAEKAEAEWLAAEEESRRVAEEEKKAMEETKKRKAEEMKRAVLEQIALMKGDRA